MRWAVNVAFLVHGAVFANWASRIPAIREALGLSERALGFTLLGMSVGVIIGLPLASWLITRLGSRRVTVGFGVAQALGLILLALTPSGVLLFMVLILVGMSASIMDIGMNAQAVEVEHRTGKPIMSSFHAMFSIGGFVGAGMGAVLAGFGWAPLPHFGLAAGVAVITLVVAYRWLVSIPAEHQTTDAPVFTLPPLAVLPLGMVAFCSTIGEGVMADWSALYLQEVANTGPAQAALGFSVFNLAMTAGRLSGDGITERLGARRMIPLGGGLAAIGLAVAVIIPQAPAILVGFGLAGLGLATIIPLAFSAAGRAEGVQPGRGIAGVATIGYAGFLAAPPVIGVIAEGVGLRTAMALVAVVVGLLVVIGPQALHSTDSNQ